MIPEPRGRRCTWEKAVVMGERGREEMQGRGAEGLISVRTAKKDMFVASIVDAPQSSREVHLLLAFSKLNYWPGFAAVCSSFSFWFLSN